MSKSKQPSIASTATRSKRGRTVKEVGAETPSKRIDPSDHKAHLYESSSAATIHEGVEGLYNLGFVSEEEMGEMDTSCLTPVDKVASPDIAALRSREGVTQSVLARYLGVATATVGQWERGLRKPDGPVLKLLALIERNGIEYIR